MSQQVEDDDDGTLLTPAEVARMFRVDAKTVTRWAKDRLIASIRTPGGHRRFRPSVVKAAMRDWEGLEGSGAGAGEPERIAA